MTESPSELQVDQEEEEWTPTRLSQASYKDLGTPAQVEDRFMHHLLTSEACRHSLSVLLRQTSATTRDHSITVDTFDLIQADPVLGHLTLKFPATLLPLLENAVVRAQENILSGLPQQQPTDSTTDEEWTVKGSKTGNGTATTRVHARLVHLPPYCCKTSLATIHAEDVGRIVQVSGTVVRTSPIQMVESARTYKCSGSKGCHRTFVVYADPEQRNNALQKPERCPLFLQTGDRCEGTTLNIVEGGSVHTDYQEIKIQEAASSLAIGHIPRSLLVKLQHDLVDHCQPGDEVVIVGSLLAQWQQQTVIPDVDCQVGIAMSAHSIRVVADSGASAWKNTSKGDTSLGAELDKFRKEFDDYWNRPKSIAHPIAARDSICKAVCPKLYGLQVIKLALLVTLIGGVSSEAYESLRKEKENQAQNDQEHDLDHTPDQFQIMDSGSNKRKHITAYYMGEIRESTGQYQEEVKTRRRDQSHILLVGDPGTGKSQILRFAAALCPRSVLTTGVGTTSAGLTCAAVREGNGKEFALEAGALVLADKGVCCIDEFGCIQEQDRTTIHEAMEQQTLSVAKAGIVCKLNCRATIIAVMNPRNGLYDNHASLAENTGLGTPLLSRFDLIFKLIDSSDAERDSNVTTYLLNRAIQGAGFDVPDICTNHEDEEGPWSMDKLRAYIAIVKDAFQPIMTDAAAILLERHYEKSRSSQSSTIPITVRFLESMIRLSQAHARLMYRDSVTLEDAVAVLRLMECSAFAYGGFDSGVPDFENVMYCDPMVIDFSDEADLDFICFEYRLLDRYGMLDYMRDDHRRAARDELNQTGATVSMDTGGWSSMEHARDRAVRQPNGYSAPQRSTQFENSYNSHWDNSSVSQTQDHYGRDHGYSQWTRKRVCK